MCVRPCVWGQNIDVDSVCVCCVLQVAEQYNSKLRYIATQCAYMGHEMYMEYMKLFMFRVNAAILAQMFDYREKDMLRRLSDARQRQRQRHEEGQHQQPPPPADPAPDNNGGSGRAESLACTAPLASLPLLPARPPPAPGPAAAPVAGSKAKKARMLYHQSY